MKYLAYPAALLAALPAAAHPAQIAHTHPTGTSLAFVAAAVVLGLLSLMWRRS